MVLCVGWRNDHPHNIDNYLDRYQCATDNKLRLGGDKTGSFCWLLAGLEYASYSIRFCEQSSVDNGEAEASSESVESGQKEREWELLMRSASTETCEKVKFILQRKHFKIVVTLQLWRQDTEQGDANTISVFSLIRTCQVDFENMAELHLMGWFSRKLAAIASGHFFLLWLCGHVWDEDGLDVHLSSLLSKVVF